MAVSENASVLVWFRQDLRLSDHPALSAALAREAPVIPVFVWDPEAEGAWVPGRASRWWLARSLEALDASLRKRGSRLICRKGEAGAVLVQLARETGATEVHFTRRYEPAVAQGDVRIAERLRAAGIRVTRHGGNLLREPETLRTRAGEPFRVFTPFWKAFQALDHTAPPPPPLDSPDSLPAPARWPEGLPPADPSLIPVAFAERGWAGRWSPGEARAQRALDDFILDALEDYPDARDIPADPGTSRLSPHLHFGEISPRQIVHALRARAPRGSRAAASAASFARELAWREFAHHVLVHFPETPERPLRPAFAAFPWSRDEKALEAWRRGLTGYPLVDAGMRELAATGFMHNRVRMAAASFLVKHLLVPWQEGARWFWESLVDADLAVNTFNWQWVAGCGADAAPYFRIFSPVSQGERFDPHGDYVRRWVPEVAALPDRLLHRPFDAPPLLREAAGIGPGKAYPDPLVAHGFARERALSAFHSLPR